MFDCMFNPFYNIITFSVGFKQSEMKAYFTGHYINLRVIFRLQSRNVPRSFRITIVLVMFSVFTFSFVHYSRVCVNLDYVKKLF